MLKSLLFLRSLLFPSLLAVFLMSNLAVFSAPFSASSDSPALPAPLKVRTLYNSLDPLSVAQHLAFYQLYQEYPEGQRALKDLLRLLCNSDQTKPADLTNSHSLTHAIHSIVKLVNKQPDEDLPELTNEELAAIQQLAQDLPHHQLSGHQAISEEQMIALPPDQIDLARGLFLTQLGDENFKKIHTYEALIDLMALQIRARLPKEAPPAIKIRMMNDFIFGEMGFRFPPHSAYSKNIDVYTFLPSVLDSRRGVCLGVSILYICLAQRLGLSLEMITPPGHIYVRYRNGEQVINIETTARGVHIDSEEYLGIETRSLQQRNIKEVIGLAHFNQASVYWQQEKYQDAVAAYEKAEAYLPDDMLLKELKGYSLILSDRLDEGLTLLRRVKGHVPEYAITGDQMAEDFLDGKVGPEGIQAIFKTVDESRQSILAKRDLLLQVLVKYPEFKSGLFALAISWIQLHRAGEALEVLERYHQLDANDPSVEYYLAVLYTQRFHYSKAWEHLKNAETLLAARGHKAKQLKALRRELSQRFPD